MSILSADDITQAEHYTKQTLVKRWLILMLYCVCMYLQTLISSTYGVPSICLPPSCYNKLCQDFDKGKWARNTEYKMYNILFAIERKLNNLHKNILKQEKQSFQEHETKEGKTKSRE